MKIIWPLIFLIILTSCNEVSQPSAQLPQIDKAWQPKIIREQEHIYNKHGFLDTSYEVEKYYISGELRSTMNFLILRKYDTKNNLTSEKSFQVLKRVKKLSEERIFQYDNNNNLISKTELFENVLSEILRIKYNDLNQKVEEMKIQEIPELIHSDWTIDSMIAHHNDKKKLQFDTLTTIYYYNANGNIFKEEHRKSNQLQWYLVTEFTGNQKTLAFEINSKDDTVSIIKYQKQNNFITEIRNDKMQTMYTDTTVYDGDRKMKTVSIDKRLNYRNKEIYKYDYKGNEVECITLN